MALKQTLGSGMAILSVFWAVFYVSGWRINTTRSIPRGIYALTDRRVTQGDYVVFCPPEKPIFKEALSRGYVSSGFCAGGYGPLMKKVMGAADDILTINGLGVFLNGRLLPFSQPLLADGAGRVLTHVDLTDYRLKANELLLMTDVIHNSFDARYFGLVDQSQIEAVIDPVINW